MHAFLEHAAPSFTMPFIDTVQPWANPFGTKEAAWVILHNGSSRARTQGGNQLSPQSNVCTCLARAATDAKVTCIVNTSGLYLLRAALAGQGRAASGRAGRRRAAAQAARPKSAPCLRGSAPRSARPCRAAARTTCAWTAQLARFTIRLMLAALLRLQTGACHHSTGTPMCTLQLWPTAPFKCTWRLLNVHAEHFVMLKN